MKNWKLDRTPEGQGRITYLFRIDKMLLKPGATERMPVMCKIEFSATDSETLGTTVSDHDHLTASSNLRQALAQISGVLFEDVQPIPAV